VVAIVEADLCLFLKGEKSYISLKNIFQGEAVARADLCLFGKIESVIY